MRVGDKVQFVVKLEKGVVVVGGAAIVVWVVHNQRNIHSDPYGRFFKG